MAISQEWWDRWWAEDWSWEGLTERPWQGWVVLPDGVLAENAEFAQFENQGWETRFPEGTRLATLQDYWRRAGCADDLYPEPGTDRAFTLIHLPPKWRDGTETIKADPENPPEALIALLKEELRREEQETIFRHGWQLSGADHRLQWNGIVLPDFNLANLSPQVRSEDNKIPIGVTANGAAFSGGVEFRSAAFSGDAEFRSAAFSGDADFESAAFSGDADFESAAFSGDADFISAAFSGNAYFMSAAFSGNAYFMSAAFSDNAYFSSAIFLSDAIFSGQGNSVRSDAIKAVIRPEPGGAGGQIYEQAEDVMWTARRSFPNADFQHTFFLERAQFDNRDFHSQTSFGGAVFLRQTAFHSAELHRGVHFRDTSFAFALERGRSPLNVRPRSRKGGWRDLRHGLLDWFTSTSRPIRLEWSQVKTIIRARRRLYKAFRQAFGDDVPRWRYWKVFFAQFLENRETEFQHQPQHQKNLYYAGVEDCFRTLKHKMEDRRDRGQEARFFKMELLARRERRRDPHVPWWEGPMSWMYRATSDFGTSFAQPLVSLTFLTIVVFPFLYLLMGAGFTHWPTLAELGDAMGYSFARVLPFGPWEEPQACSMTARMLAEVAQPECPPVRGLTDLHYRGGTPFWLRFWGSIQSLIALVLVFLSGLAIRRRFQIN